MSLLCYFTAQTHFTAFPYISETDVVLCHLKALHSLQLLSDTYIFSKSVGFIKDSKLNDWTFFLMDL